LAKSNTEATEDLKGKMRELNHSLKDSESELSKLSSRLNGLLLNLPNLLHDSVPDGSDESSNKKYDFGVSQQYLILRLKTMLCWVKI
jgi:seryl-tRNA synthetase